MATMTSHEEATGSFSWVELTTPDPSAVAPFHQTMLGWTSEFTPMSVSDHTMFTVDKGDENGITGVVAPPVEGMTPEAP